MPSFYPFSTPVFYEDDCMQYESYGAPHLHSDHEFVWDNVDPKLRPFHPEHLHSPKQYLADRLEYTGYHQSFNFAPTSSVHYPDNFRHFNLHNSHNHHLEAFRNTRYDSPGGPFGGSTSESSSDYAISPEAARNPAAYSPLSLQNSFLASPMESQLSQHTWTSSQGFGQSFSPIPHGAPTFTPAPAADEFEFECSPILRGVDDLQVKPPSLAPLLKVSELSHSIKKLSTSGSANAVVPIPTPLESDNSDIDDHESSGQDRDSDADFDPRRGSRRQTVNGHSAARNGAQQRSPRRSSTAGKPAILDTASRVTKSSHNRRKSSSQNKPNANGMTHVIAMTATRPVDNAVKTARSFPCAFHPFGCTSTFANKNEWKRHVTSQHLQLGVYRCDMGNCNPDNVMAEKRQKNGVITITYNDFNRKDLFTQHCRRMHGPHRHTDDNSTQTNQKINARARQHSHKARIVKQTITKDDETSFEIEMDEIRRRCWHFRRKAPERTVCGFCQRVFEASSHKSSDSDDEVGKKEEKAWEERMEHIGKHYERDSCSKDTEVEVLDDDLIEWGLREEIMYTLEDGRAWLVGCELPDSISAGETQSGGQEATVRRKGLRTRRGRVGVGRGDSGLDTRHVKLEIKDEHLSDEDASGEDE